MIKDKKIITIIVNAREKEWSENRISYEDVIVLAFGEYKDRDEVVYTVAFSYPRGNKNGTLTKGQDTNAKDGMIFNVNKTDKS